MTLLHFTHVSAYADYPEEHPEEVERLIQSIWIGVTDFFRDPAVFEALPRLVWPALLARRDGEEPLRIGVPGCSTGEEAYSLAISLHAFQQQRGLIHPFQIFATDINVKALATALQMVGPAFQSRYFTPLDEQHMRYRINPSLREHCLFAPHDLLRDPPFTHVHLISCRNVLIFLQITAQRPILQTFHYALVPEGFLLLGIAESIEPLTRYFRRVERPLPLYRKQVVAASMLLPFTMSAGGAAAPLQKEGVLTMSKEPELANYAPASVVIDPNQEVARVRGETGPYLHLAAGRANLNLLKMARPGLAQGVREAVRAARSEQHIVIREDLRVTAIPLKGPPAKQYCLVLFEEQVREEVSPEAAPEPTPASPVERKARRDQAQRRIAELEQELSATYQELSARHEQLKAAQEYAEAIVETARAPLVVLSADLRVEQANQAFYQLFQVTPAETEVHFFAQLGHGQWDIPQLSNLFAEIVTANHSFQDFEVDHTFPTVGHKVLLLNARRLLLAEPPTDKHRILLAMEDITERRTAERQVEARLAFLRHLLDALPSSVSLVQGNEARLVLANQAAMRMWGAEWPIGQPLLDFLQSHAITICDRRGQAVPAARLVAVRALQEGQGVADEQEVIHHADGTELAVIVNAVPFTDPELLTGLAATVGNGQIQAAEPAALVVQQQAQKLREGKKTSTSG